MASCFAINDVRCNRAIAAKLHVRTCLVPRHPPPSAAASKPDADVPMPLTGTAEGANATATERQAAASSSLLATTATPVTSTTATTTIGANASPSSSATASVGAISDSGSGSSSNASASASTRASTKVPHSRVKKIKKEARNVDGLDFVYNFIMSHPFNHAMEVFTNCPCAKQLVESLHAAASAQWFYTVNCTLWSLVEKTFVDRYVCNKTGSFIALSVGTVLDTGNSCAILPSGHLVLRLERDTYQSFGLVGSPIKRPKEKKPSSYLVVINLAEERYHPGAPSYDRIQWCLANHRVESLSMLVSYTENGLPCPVEFPPDCVVGKHELASMHEYAPAIFAPSYNDIMAVIRSTTTPAKNKREEDGDLQQDLQEWIGLHSWKSPALSPEVQLSSSFALVAYAKSSGWSLRCKGLLPSAFVSQCLSAIRAVLEPGQWAVLSTWGFPDSVVAWSTQPHNRSNSCGGINSYSVVLAAPEEQPTKMHYSLLCVVDPDSGTPHM
ncbi:ribonuclease P [Pelomyxa schiedti]|nr:ribonuclease P [Pelomyxa schiedti]